MVVRPPSAPGDSAYLPAVCSVPGCGRVRWSRLYCGRHHDRLTRYGDVRADLPLVVRNSPAGLPAGFTSDVPLEDAGTFFGAVILCARCSDQLGPVHDADEAVRLANAHAARYHA